MSKIIDNSHKIFAISGFTGFIGSNFFNLLRLKRFKKIYLISRVPMNLPENFKNCEVINVGKNYRNIKKFKKILNTIDIFYHFAYQNDPSISKKKIYCNLFNNLNPIKKILNNLKINSLFIFTSSAAVYGSSSIYFTEADKINPLSSYDLNKIFCENYIKNYCARYRINYLIFRLSNIYGVQKKNTLTKRGFLFTFIKKISFNKNIKLNTNGKYLRDYLYIDDCINGLMKAISLRKFFLNKTYNLVYGRSYSLKNIFYITKKILVKDFKVKSSSQLIFKRFLNLPYTDLRNFRGSSQLYKSNSRWKPVINIKVGIKKIINEVFV